MHVQGKLPELLIPASDLETLKVAVHYGADAVYIGGEAFSLRARARNFSEEDMRAGVAWAHDRGVKVYVTVNILAHNKDLEQADSYLDFLGALKPDALLVADPGIFVRARKICPHIPLHISTQANNVNYETFRFWHELGAERVVCGRELSLREIRQIREHIPDSLEIEAFVHGAMCISYSGRCLLSNFFAGRDANQGACTHPCRWQYRVFGGGGYYDKSGMRKLPGEDSEGGYPDGAGAGVCADGAGAGVCADGAGAGVCPDETGSDGYSGVWIEEETRPGEKIPVYENERGTFIFNSKDLCMIEHIPDMVEAGIDSLKIEGRMKNALYVATAARTYRRALDNLRAGRGAYESNMDWYRRQIHDCTFRPFTTGFFYGRPGSDSQIYDSNTYEKSSTYLGCVQDTVQIDGHQYIVIVQKNKFSVGETVELMASDGDDRRFTITGMLDEEGRPIDSAPHPQQRIFIRTDAGADRFDILRRPEMSSQ